MIRLPTQRERPESWKAFRRKTHYPWLAPFLWLDWSCQHAAFYLSRWSFLEVLDYLGTFSILFAVILYFTEADQRREQKHYQAWQVINTAQGKGGNGGRIDALQELNADHISLIGIDLDESFLQFINLDNAMLNRATFHNADVRQASFRHADLQWTRLQSTNLRQADLTNADLSNANIADSDLTGANLSGTHLAGVILDNTDLVNANLAALTDWRSIKSLHGTNIHGVQNPPAGFVQWALKNGAVDTPPDNQ